jgi:hypothetical protein
MWFMRWTLGHHPIRLEPYLPVVFIDIAGMEMSPLPRIGTEGYGERRGAYR